MKALIKNLIIVLVIFLTIAGVFALFAQPMEKEEDLSLTQLVEEINQGKIEEIIVTGNELAISFYNGTKAKSRKETEAGLSESLLNYGANASEVKELNIKYEKEGSGLGWLLSATILLPLVLFFLFFWMIFKQSKSGAMQAFNFSKAKIKMFGGKGTNKDRVTFKDVAGLKEAKEETCTRPVGRQRAKFR